MKGDWAAARRLLCVRTDNLGDVLMTTPALRALKAADPARHLALLTSAGGAALAPHLEMVDEVLAYEAPWVRAAADDPAAHRACIERLAARRYDGAVIFTVYSQNPLPAALACLLAGIPRRLAHCRENPYALLSDWLPETEPQQHVRHEVRRQLDLVAAVGATTADERLAFTVRAEDRRGWRRTLRALRGDPALPLVVVHPGASAASRRYPPQAFARAIDLLAARRPCRVVATGDAAEAPLLAALVAAVRTPVTALAGRLTLGQLGAALADADLLIANNTGPVHLAAALGTPVVDLYALTNPQHTPWQVPQRVLYRDQPCRWCYKSICPEGHQRCLLDVTPEEVAAAAGELLDAACAGARRSA